MSIINALQRNMSLAQCIPVVGPLVVSPAKVLLSTVQIIAGLAKAVFFGSLGLTAAVFDQKNMAATLFLKSGTGFLDMFNGTCSMIYSCANMSTFGLVGLTCELAWANASFKARLLV